MKCYQHATTDSKKVIDREVKDHFLRVWDTLGKAMDACYLIELHTNPQTRFGKVRLKRAWKKIGVDLDEWYRELERERHR